MSEIKWPKTMPILNGHDMFLGGMSSPCGRRHCLWGHSQTLCRKRQITPAVEKAVDSAVKQAIVESTKNEYETVVGFNDTHSCADNAKIWNRAMYLLGYTEGNPQSKPVKLKE